jgi:oligopeptide transport system ATP-binding protein
MRRDMQMVFQDPYASLNPRMTAGGDCRRGVDRSTASRASPGSSATCVRGAAAHAWASQRDYIDRYPHEFSGGQRQRIGIARAHRTQARI